MNAQLSPESEKRNNEGKLRRRAGNYDNGEACDESEMTTHKSEMKKAMKEKEDSGRRIALQTEMKRHFQYYKGQESESPVKKIREE